MKIHNSLASLHAIVEKTNAEKEELKKVRVMTDFQSLSSWFLPLFDIYHIQLQCSGSSESVSPRETEKEGKKEGEKSPREKKEERERFEKKKMVR